MQDLRANRQPRRTDHTMRFPTRRPLRTSLLTSCAITAASVGMLSGCASSHGTGAAGTLPARDQAFNRSEVYINQILLALHKAPTTRFTYSEGPCNETDDSHGAIIVNYSLPVSLTATQVTEELKSAGSNMQQLGYGTPVYQDQEGSVYVDVGPFSILVGADTKSVIFSVQTCYATPAPTGVPIAGVMLPLTVSPAPTSTAGTPVGVPSPSGSG